MANEKAVLKVVSNQTREYNALILEHNTLLKVHAKAVNDCAEIECKRYELRKDNVELRKIIKQWEVDNAILQESLDGAQREIERLNDFITKHNDISELMKEEGYMG